MVSNARKSRLSATLVPKFQFLRNVPRDKLNLQEAIPHQRKAQNELLFLFRKKNEKNKWLDVTFDSKIRVFK